MIRSLVALAASAGAAAAFEVVPTHYVCARGVEIAAVYVNAADGAAAVLTVENRQIALVSEPTGSGARYGWPSDGSGYVWWTKGDGATLLWRDGTANGTETVLLDGCRAG